jgi:predicted RNase H-like nuclease
MGRRVCLLNLKKAQRNSRRRRVRVVGIDGAPGGWVAVLLDSEQTGADRWSARFHRTFVEAIAAYPHVQCIGVDMPIGLLEGGARQCDLEARKLLGPKRSSVFAAPDRRFFGLATHAEATARSVELTGAGISQQAFGILGKVAEVDRVMTPLQNWISEVHPEFSFAVLAGAPVLSKKKDADGYDERAELLRKALAIDVPSRALARSLARPAAAEDVLDALIAA